MRERFDHLRAMGIRTVMITGDNRLTAAKIAEESGACANGASTSAVRKVSTVGFSNGCAELTLKNPPPSPGTPWPCSHPTAASAA